MNTGKQDRNTAALLQRLLDAVDDSALFGDIDESAGKPALDEHRVEAREAMRALFTAAQTAWDRCMDAGDAGSDTAPEASANPFAKLHSAYPHLTDRSQIAYRDAIKRLAETTDQKDRDFLYFTLGTLSAAWSGLSAVDTEPGGKEPLLDRLRSGFTRIRTSSAD